jgi:hypothetical protein
VSRFGVPTCIVSDQGTQFESSLFSALLHQFGCARHRTTAYHPQSNGAIERSHRTIKNAFRALCQREYDWETKLPTILMGMRSSVCEPTQTPPSRLVLGGDIRMPADYFQDQPQRSSFSSATGPCYADRVERDIRQFTDLAVHNQPRRPISHIPTMPPWVWLKQIPGSTSLKRPYEGPYRNIKQDRSVVTINKNGKEIIVNVDRLKPAFILADDSAHSREGPISSQPEGNQAAAAPSVSRYGRRQSFRFGQPIYHTAKRSHREGE